MRTPNALRRFLLACAVIGLVSLAPMPTFGQAPVQASDRDEKIKQLEKTLQELQKQIDEIKKGGAVAGNGLAAMPGGIPAEWTKMMNWRSIGPGSMGGRIVDLAVFEADPCVYWVATASGGLLKTENNGVTFDHQFDHEATVSIGAVAVAQSDKNVVWVGTGENNPRNSVSYGDGVYKSTDGGKSWKNMGLKKTFQIGRIIVHPKDPNIVYVGALEQDLINSMLGEAEVRHRGGDSQASIALYRDAIAAREALLENRSRT